LVESKHRMDMKFSKIEGSSELIKAIEMKNWSFARETEGDTYKQFRAYLQSKKPFEYHFNGNIHSQVKERFQELFTDIDIVEDLWDVNPQFFKGFPDVQAVVDGANANKLIGHSILNFVK